MEFSIINFIFFLNPSLIDNFNYNQLFMNLMVFNHYPVFSQYSGNLISTLFMPNGKFLHFLRGQEIFGQKLKLEGFFQLRWPLNA